jgi:hypothetical protein
MISRPAATQNWTFSLAAKRLSRGIEQPGSRQSTSSQQPEYFAVFSQITYFTVFYPQRIFSLFHQHTGHSKAHNIPYEIFQRIDYSTYTKPNSIRQYFPGRRRLDRFSSTVPAADSLQATGRVLRYLKRKDDMSRQRTIAKNRYWRESGTKTLYN